MSEVFKWNDRVL